MKLNVLVSLILILVTAAKSPHILLPLRRGSDKMKLNRLESAILILERAAKSPTQIIVCLIRQ